MFSDRLKSLRIQHGKTQQDMADFLGVSRQGYAKYENDLGEPDNSKLAKLADFFAVSTDYLLGRTEKQNLTSEEQDEVAFKVFSEDPELKKFYRELYESDEEAVKKLRDIWEIIKHERK
ncbi:helix-turn-helix transcriptional regulator [Metasolibacillus sp.]|uniref:helix-turn-helix domain-containing protein n=1 Tax=Metasolibacillus sp. TaxID=2703680 RepID=UPI0025F5B8DA|nr:helix-turn-helix transcriptional regulator [Metasolibacillus sp.]MCT6925598.1 helix-turn-helix domain-containing protein [Metasolibacillus sp.]MCT6941753.1 helix-turn-helix domain-containing protein [Metasolibacillus sp.]